MTSDRTIGNKPQNLKKKKNEHLHVKSDFFGC